MKTFYKVSISFGLGICLIAAGVSIGGLNEVSSFNFLKNFHFNWTPYATDDINFKADSHINEIEINVHKGTIDYQEKDDIQNIEIYASQIYNGFDVYQKGYKIVIEQPHYWRWFNNYDEARIQINVPTGYQLNKVDIDMSAGKTTVNQLKVKELAVDAIAGQLKVNNVSCDELELDASMGETIFNQFTCSNKMDIDLSMGNVEMRLTGHRDEYNYNVDVGLGNVDIGNETFSGIVDRHSQSSPGQKLIDVNCGIGNVSIGMEDY